MTKRILFLTGKRGGFGAMEPTLQAIRDHPTLELKTYVCDQHLHHRFGSTITEVTKFDPRYLHGACPATYHDVEGRLSYMGTILAELPLRLREYKIDILLLIGDRLESLMGAITAHNLNIPIAHVQAGDITGGVDNAQRWAISHMSRWCFAGNKDALTRLQRKLTDAEIHLVGDVHIDRLMQERGKDPTAILDRLGLSSYKIIILLQHPDTLHPEKSYEQIAETIDALKYHQEDGYQIVAIYPCSDQGHDDIISELDCQPWVVERNIPHGEFITLLEQASCLVGNSSCGIIEAPYLNTPSVDIGNRQKGRGAGETAKIMAASHNAKSIQQAITAAMDGSWPIEKYIPQYGDGTAYQKIVEVLAND